MSEECTIRIGHHEVCVYIERLMVCSLEVKLDERLGRSCDAVSKEGASQEVARMLNGMSFDNEPLSFPHCQQ